MTKKELQICKHPEIKACFVYQCKKTGDMIIDSYKCSDCKKIIAAKNIETIPPAGFHIKLFAIQS